MRHLTLFRRDERGLTLVELMASLVLFSLVTVGIAPLLISSVRGSGMSRTYTIGKNLAVQAMERIRGLQYFVSYASQNKPVDVLDLYFPAASGPGYNATNRTYTTTCTSATEANASCPEGLPEGYTIEYVAEFVRASNTEVEDYAPVSADDLNNYAWDGLDTPPSRILQVSVTASWAFAGTERSHTLRSLVGDRRIIADRVSGNARVDYVVQVLASYSSDTNRPDELKFRAGNSDAQIESRSLSSASISTTAGDAVLTRQPEDNPNAEADLLDRITGASGVYSAPPVNVDSGAPDDKGPLGLEHPQHGRVAGFASTRADQFKARIVDENPESSGAFGWNTAGDGQVDVWVNNQASFGTETQLKLNNGALSPGADSVPAILNITKRTGTSVSGSAEGFTGSLDDPGNRRVRTTASARFGQLNLFPVSFVSGSNPSQRSVIQVRDFTSNVTCDSTASSSATASATYSATLRYWSVDSWSPSNPQGSSSNTAGSYKSVAPDGTPLDLDGSNTEDLLKKIGPEPSKNPLVWKSGGLLSFSDIYLFPITHQHGLITHNHPGYLDPEASWESAFDLDSSVEESDDGRNTRARISGAIRITTVPLNSNIGSSGLNITVGNLACDASDLR